MTTIEDRFMNAEYLLKHSREAYDENDKEYSAGMISDLIDELKDIKKELGYE